MSVIIEVAESASTELLEAINHLVPQLSSSAVAVTGDQLEAMVTSDCLTVFVARSGGAIVGTLTLATFPIPTGLRAWIEDVIVDEESRGLGIGESLTIAALDVARARGARTVDLTSRPSRMAANALYKRLGFVQRETNVYRFFIDNDPLT